LIKIKKIKSLLNDWKGKIWYFCNFIEMKQRRTKMIWDQKFRNTFWWFDYRKGFDQKDDVYRQILQLVSLI
jgi:hypothetical protein